MPASIVSGVRDNDLLSLNERRSFSADTMISLWILLAIYLFLIIKLPIFKLLKAYGLSILNYQMMGKPGLFL